MMPIVDVLVRHVPRWSTVRDLALLVAVGSLVGFLIMYVGHASFTKIAFEAALSYGTKVVAQVEGASGGLAVVSSTEDVLVADASDRRDDEMLYLPQSASPTLWVYDRADSARVDSLLRHNLFAGDVGAEGAMIDEATAFSLDLDVGDSLVIVGNEPQGDADGASVSCVVPVTAILRPSIDAVTGRPGLVVAAREDCVGEVLKTLPGAEVIRFDPDTSTGATSKARALWSLVADVPTATGYVVALTLVALALWLLAIRRVVARQDSALRAPVAVLVALGVAPRRVATFRVVLITVIVSAAGLVAGFVARTASHSIAGWYFQPGQVWALAALFTAVGVVVARLTRRRSTSLGGTR